MVLMRIIETMRQDQIRLDAVLKAFKPGLYFGTLGREEAVSKAVHLDANSIDAFQEVCRGRPRFRFTGTGSGKDAPSYIERRAVPLQLQDCAAGADFNVVGMSTKTQNRKPLPGPSKTYPLTRQPQR